LCCEHALRSREKSRGTRDRRNEDIDIGRDSARMGA
jgi:hypothetical protein